MIVLIAPEKDVNNEISILNRLFEAGLTHFHLRKPYKNYQAHCDYLNQIDSKYHNRIITHHFHELINNFNLKGIHFQEAKRRESTLEMLTNIKTNNLISISSSFHSPQELMACKFNFDYHLLSPVFSSISKQGYQGQGFNVNHITNKTIIGLGGATYKNLFEFDKLGYKGVAVLGSIWHSETPLERFKIMQKHFFKSKNLI
ncbi:thiamine phosphate synthase [Mariniflexile sp.]|uniref:thiamine phosphate synthase n=1 Tax=Mariniflexile sp. TaxID=1979402 RepID=UPI003569C9BF